MRINDITNDECENILKEVRLTLIPTQDLLKVVRPTNLVQPDVLLDAIQSRTESRDMELKYRGYLSEYLFWNRLKITTAHCVFFFTN